MPTATKAGAEHKRGRKEDQEREEKHGKKRKRGKINAGGEARGAQEDQTLSETRWQRTKRQLSKTDSQQQRSGQHPTSAGGSNHTGFRMNLL